MSDVILLLDKGVQLAGALKMEDLVVWRGSFVRYEEMQETCNIK